VELWHASAKGNYNHPRDTGAGQADPNFQGHAVVTSDDNGKFQIKTIMPGSYSAGRGWIRPPHVHFRISRAGYESLSTQMYFEGHPLNQGDRLLQRKSPEQRARMMANRIEQDTTTYVYDLVLLPKTP
jgi:protocatechuate 3,4-dioxygenase beta subunit